MSSALFSPGRFISVDARPLIEAVVAEYPALEFWPEHVHRAIAAAAHCMYRNGAPIPDILEAIVTPPGAQAVAGIAWCFINDREIGVA